MAYMDSLPAELVLDIAEYLASEDAMSAMSCTFVSHRFRNIFTRVLQKKYETVVLGDLLPPVQTWPQLYHRRPDLLPAALPCNLAFLFSGINIKALQEYEELFVLLAQHKSFAMMIKTLTIDWVRVYRCYQPELVKAGCPGALQQWEELEKLLVARPFAGIRTDYKVPEPLQRTDCIPVVTPSELKKAVDNLQVEKVGFSGEAERKTPDYYNVPLMIEYIISMCQNVEVLRLSVRTDPEFHGTSQCRARDDLFKSGENSTFTYALHKLRDFSINVRESSEWTEAYSLAQQTIKSKPTTRATITKTKVKEVIWPLYDKSEKHLVPTIEFSEDVLLVSSAEAPPPRSWVEDYWW